LRRLYDRWAVEAIVDGGPWYQGALWRLGRTKQVRMVDGIRNYVERFFRKLKRRPKPFDVSFPQRRLGLTSLRRWLELYAWHYNQFLMGRRLSASS
jgi:transposase-like protein